MEGGRNGDRRGMEIGGVESENAGFGLVGCLHTTRGVRSPTFSARVRSVTESWRRILIVGTSENGTPSA